MSHAGTHYAGGAFAGLIVGETLMLQSGWTLHQTIALAAVSTATSGGALSPDMDQYGLWRLMDKWIPDEWLGGGGPLQHRNLAHWWGIPVIFLLWWHHLAAGGGLAAQVPWLGYGIAVGWLSHLALDAVYGLPVRSREGGGVVVRGGIPLFLWWVRFGGLFRSGGIGSATMGMILTVGCLLELNHLGVTYGTQIGFAALGLVAWALGLFGDGKGQRT